MTTSPHTGTDMPSAIHVWARVFAFVLAFTLLRLLSVGVWGGYTLVADEAHYWEWSRRLDWSYYTKGPGVAWAIWCSTRLLGDTVLAVKLPGVLASAGMMLGAAALACTASDNHRAPLLATVSVGLMPGFVVIGMLTTTDGPYAALWLLTVMFWARCGWHWALAAGLALGAAALFKYTALLLMPGLLLDAIWGRHFERRRWGLLLVGTSVGLTPVFIWNATRGWPTIAHQLGRIGAPGGDEVVVAVGSDWSWTYFPEFVGAQLALLGVIGVALIGLSIAWAWGQRERTHWPALRLLIAAAAPILVFYFTLSVFKRTQGNWAVGGYTTLITLVGIAAADRLTEQHRRIRMWRELPEPKPKAGIVRRRPELWFGGFWDWYVGIGTVVLLILVIGPGIFRLPVLRDIRAVTTVRQRIDAGPVLAANVQPLIKQLRRETGREPMIVCDRYDDASLLAFYLPDQPVIFCANSMFGGRPTAYDFFIDTNLAARGHMGRPVVLVGERASAWRGVLQLDGLRDAGVVGEKPLYIATRIDGVVDQVGPER